MKSGMRIFFLLVMLASAGIYFDMNSYKVAYLWQVFNEIKNGESAPGIELKINSETVFHHRLRSSDFFDASGTRQVSFLKLDPSIYDRIAGNSTVLTLKLDGNDVPSKAIEKGKTVQLTWADRKLIIVRSGDLKEIAENIAHKNSNRKGLYECFTATFCQSIRISIEGIGPVEGPYLDNDINKLRRGLPMGSWGYGPSSKISILSEISQEAVIGFYMLRLNEDQEIDVKGPILAQMSLPAGDFRAPYDGLQLYPEARAFKISLQPGVNVIELSYSNWMELNGPAQAPKAVFITGIKIKPMTS